MQVVNLLLVLVFLSLTVCKAENELERKPVSPLVQNGWKRVSKHIALPDIWGRLVSEGITHDKENWFLNSKHVIYKATRDPVKLLMKNENAIPKELREQKFDHIGDIDCVAADGVIYGGFEQGANTPGILASWNSTDLSLIQYKHITQNGAPWVAADPTTRLLYSTAWNDQTRINVFDMDTLQQRDDLTIVPISSDPAALFPKEIQGAAFNPADPGFLYISINGAESVYKIDVKTGACTFVLSDKVYKHHDAEMEGITFWDLSDIGYGNMHMFGNFEEIRQKGIHSYAKL